MIEPLRVAVVEDEPPARAALKLLVAQDPELQLSVEAGCVEDALRGLKERPAALLFLDINLERRTGFDLLEALGPARPQALVFVTAYEAHAVHAFEVEAVDYLLKPFDDQRFHLAVSRAKERLRFLRANALAQQLTQAYSSAPHPEQTLALRDGARATFLRLDEIDWIEAQDYYVEIHAGKATYLHREPMRDFEKRLEGTRFARIHRSAIVQLDRIRELRSLPSGDASVVLRDGTELRLSRSRREALSHLLGL
ncbi:MAG TPA: LytTR family DNA-binding domain-containing protein [Myxococcales bacterium]|jgi:two-component system LytT family response regulator|nr:LytTR family DNA-binding domain-containing protein [Myxococcales bacterium]